jgi:hypothetical protein
MKHIIKTVTLISVFVMQCSYAQTKDSQCNDTYASSFKFWQGILSTTFTALPIGIISGLICKTFTQWLEKQSSGMIEPLLKQIDYNAYTSFYYNRTISIEQEKLGTKIFVCYLLAPLIRNLAITSIGQQARQTDAPYNTTLGLLLGSSADWFMYLQ